METSQPYRSHITPPSVPNKDADSMRLLVVFHYIVAGLLALFSFFPLLYVFLGVMVFTDPSFFSNGRQNHPPPDWFAWMFIIMGSVFAILGWITSVCAFLSARKLSKYRKRTFSLIVAAILCLFMPFGTVLGIFTLIVLNRESVKQLYRTPPTS